MAGAARDEHPDCIVLELMLPRVDGHEVLRTLREDDDTGRIPILLLTARKEEKVRVNGFEVVADDYVTKPFSARELVPVEGEEIELVETVRGFGYRFRAMDRR